MIGLPRGVRVLVATRPVDFRRADRVKIVTWYGTGLVMVWKALDEGAF